jgi:cold shock CspA family protein
MTGDRVAAACVQWSHRRGFGFVRVSDRDIYVHATSLRAAPWLVTGDLVECRIVRDANGRAEAVDVEVIQSAGICGWW